MLKEFIATSMHFCILFGMIIESLIWRKRTLCSAGSEIYAVVRICNVLYLPMPSVGQFSLVSMSCSNLHAVPTLLRGEPLKFPLVTSFSFCCLFFVDLNVVFLGISQLLSSRAIIYCQNPRVCLYALTVNGELTIGQG